jgi:hypothetical protein
MDKILMLSKLTQMVKKYFWIGFSFFMNQTKEAYQIEVERRNA